METGNNISPRYNYRDNDIRQLNLPDCELVAYLGVNQFDYSIVDRVRNLVVNLVSYHYSDLSLLENTLKNIDLFNDEQLSALRIGVDVSPGILVPDALYQDEPALYYEFNTGTSGFEVKADSLKDIASKNIYNLSEGISNFIKNLNKESHIIHGASAFIINTLKENKNKKDDLLFANYCGDHCSIIGMANGTFLYYNSFEIKTKEDLVYYLIAVCEELLFHPEMVMLQFTGELEVDAEELQLLKRFLPNLKLGTRPKAFKYGKALSRLPQHRFHHLLSINACA